MREVDVFLLKFYLSEAGLADAEVEESLERVRGVFQKHLDGAASRRLV